MAKVLWLAINYNSGSSLRDLLLSIARMPQSEDVETIVVDNGEPEAQAIINDLTSDLKQKVRALNPGQNLGYLGGARAGLAEYLQACGYPEYVVVSNVDLIVEETFLASLFGSDISDNTGIIGPSIKSPKGRTDLNPQYRTRPSSRKFQRLKMICRHRWLLNAYIGASFIKSKLAKRKPHQAQEPSQVYSIHGSCMVFTRLFFERGGNLDHKPFLFGEEITLAERCRSLDLDIFYDPNLHILHKEHETTGLFRNRQIAKYQAEAARYLADTYFNE